MNEILKHQIKQYFLQQSDLDMPDFIFQSTIAPRAGTWTQIPQDSIINKQITPDSSNEKSYAKKREALVALYYTYKMCQNCLLQGTRKKMVFGSGKVNAPLMIIGEAPGFEEDIQGKPFVGKAGELLTRMLQAISIDREKSTFVTNVLKCRPPENRNPNQQETCACLPLLHKQIDIITPKVILLLGRIAVHALLNNHNSISKIRMETHLYNSIPVVVTYHPAALLRNSSYKRPTWEDLQRLKKLLN